MRDCLKPCHSLDILVTGQNLYPSDKTFLRLYFKSDVPKSEEKSLYQWRNLFAEIGGYVGIFLGYSCFSFAKFVIAYVDRHYRETFGMKIDKTEISVIL